MGRLDTESGCRDAMSYYYDYLSEQHHQIPTSISEHIEQCEHCQQELKWLKEIDTKQSSFVENSASAADIRSLELHYSLIGHAVSCSTIKAFLPVMAIGGQEVTVPTPVTVHIDRCSRCREDFQTLKKLNLTTIQYGMVCTIFSKNDIDFVDRFSPEQIEAISDILNRPDSDVITCFRLKDSEKELYEVDILPGRETLETRETVLHQNEHSVVTAPKASQQRLLKRYWSGLTAAAAVLVVGIFLMFSGPSVQATDIGQIYEALKNVKNISMTYYDALEPEPLQQIWVSRSLGVKLFKTGETYSLWDIKNKTQKTLKSTSSEIESESLNRSEIRTVSETMNIPYGLLPFKHTSELPAGAVWERVRSSDTNAVYEESTEVYDLMWTHQTGNRTPVHYRWQCRLDPVSKYPQKVLFWQKQPFQQDFEMTTVIDISYPTQTEIQNIIQQAGF